MGSLTGAQKQAAPGKGPSSKASRNRTQPAVQGQNPIPYLQRTIGNQAVLRLLRIQAGGGGQSSSKPQHPVMLHRKMTVNAPGDAYEQEADRAAEQVMRMPEPKVSDAATVSSNSPGVQRKCACGGTCEECQKTHPQEEHARVQMKAAGPGSAGGAEASPGVHEVLRSPGQSLDASTRAFMEPRFGHDFRGVRVHTGARAEQSAALLGASAYTFGQHIVFGRTAFNPTSGTGRKLIAHELAHTVQQRGSDNRLPGKSPTSALTPSGPRVARQLSGDIPRDLRDIDAQIAEITLELQMPIQPLRGPLMARLYALQQRRQSLIPRPRSQKELNEEAVRLGEKQAERRLFWNSLEDTPTYQIELMLESDEFRSKLKKLDIYWDKDAKNLLREPRIDALEHDVMFNREAKLIYNAAFDHRMNSEPVSESTFHKFMGFLCDHMAPCKDNLEQYRAELESGATVEEARLHGLVRLGVLLIPSEGPHGPIAIEGPGGEPPLELGNVKPEPPPAPAVHVEPPTPKAAEPPATAPPKPLVTSEPPTQAGTGGSTPEVRPPTKPMKAPPGGGPRGTVRATAKTITSAKPSQPEVTTLPRSSRPFVPEYSVDPYVPEKTNVSGQFRFRQYEQNGKIYQQGEGRLGMPNEVQTHRDMGAQRTVSGGTGDDAGHLIGNRFGPPGGAENLGRQNWKLNRYGNYRKLEDAWAALRFRGIEIDVQVTDVTRSGEDRPFARNVQWTETAPDGTKQSFELDFANTTTAEGRLKASGASSTTKETGGSVIHVDFGKGTKN